MAEFVWFCVGVLVGSTGLLILIWAMLLHAGERRGKWPK